MENSRLHSSGWKKVCLLVNFSERCFVAIDKKNFLTQNSGGAGVCIILNRFLHINIHGKISLISLIHIWARHCFEMSRDKISFICEKCFWSRRWEKISLIGWIIFGLEVEYLWLASFYNLGIILGTMTGLYTQEVFFLQFYEKYQSYLS